MMREEVRKNLRRGVYVIPTSLTVLNVFFGFLSILFSISAVQSRTVDDIMKAGSFFQMACWSLVVAAVFDTFDGLVARMMNATSEFGKEYDSLADVVTFGAAPAILVYSWALHLWDKLGAGIAFLFLVAGSLRLARFNINTAKTDHRFFAGLPIPAGALTLAAIVNYAPQPVTEKGFAGVVMIVTAGVAFAMISTIRYRSQKYASLQKERSFLYMFALAAFFVVLYNWTEETCFIIAISYLLSGPIVKLWSIAFPQSSLGPPASMPPSPPPPDGNLAMPNPS